MDSKFIMVSMDDERLKSISEILGNPSCKKILNLLSERRASETDISRELGMPLNTVGYNIKKLLESGLIEKAEHFFSVKGKRMPVYKVSNKSIVISPRKSVIGKLKSIVPVALISGVFTGLVAWYCNSGVQYAAKNEFDRVAESGASGVLTASSDVGNGIIQTIVSSSAWEWFLIGSISAIILFLILNWRKL